MKEQFLSHIQHTALCSLSDRILLAVSGGLDSMVMADLFITNGFSVSVAHCNFQLRGNESEEDQQLVERFCQSAGIPCYTKRFDTNSFAAQNGFSVQVAARELRYEWFREIMKQEKFDRLATAHHANDNIETVLMSLARGAELKGIPEVNQQFIRPLLRVSREQLEMYARENKVRWREDSSNNTDDYTRNFIRHHIVPRLKEINPNLEQSFEKTFAQLGLLRELADQQINSIRAKYTTPRADGIAIKKTVSKEVDHVVPLLWELIRSYGFNFSQAEAIGKGLQREPGKIFLSSSHRLVIDRDELIVTRHEKVWEMVTIAEHQTEAHFGSRFLTISHTDVLMTEDDLSIAVLDYDQIQFPLTWRTWDHGDYFYPLGMDHRKKLSDFMIDRKISVADKGHVTVLESAGEIIWVVGHRIDNRFKITQGSTSALKLTVGSILHESIFLSPTGV
jgi:tRNA(Ile)-lysidine synthase